MFGRLMSVIGIALSIAMLSSSLGLATEVPSTCFQVNILNQNQLAGGQPLENVEVQFSAGCTTPNPPNQNLWYRIIWRFNAATTGNNLQPNRDVQVDGINITVQNLGGVDQQIIAPGPNGVIDQTFYVGGNRPGNNDDIFDPPSGPPFRAIFAGPNLIADTLVPPNIVVNAGVPLPTQLAPLLETVPVGDDRIIIDPLPSSPTFGQPIIVAGDNLIAETHALVEPTTGQGMCVRSGPNLLLETTPFGDDVIGIDPAFVTAGGPVVFAVFAGVDGICDTTAAFNTDDVQIRGVGVFASNDRQVFPVGTTVGPNGYTDDIQLIPLGKSLGTNPGFDSGWIIGSSFVWDDLNDPRVSPLVAYTWPNIRDPLQVNQLVYVQFEVQVAFDPNGDGLVVDRYERLINVSIPNFSPASEVRLLDSQLMQGFAPFIVDINIDPSHDKDGFLYWGELDWGDGTKELLSEMQLKLLPERLKQSAFAIPPHTYNTPGLYKVTLSLIDNGRIPLAEAFGAFKIAETAFASPAAALAQARLNQQILLGFNNPDGLLDLPTQLHRTPPMLKQDHFFIRVLGTATAFSTRPQSGSHQHRIGTTGRDNLKIQMKVSQPLSFLPGDSITVSLARPSDIAGSLSTVASSPIGGNGKFSDKSAGRNANFSFNVRSGTLRLNLRNMDLKGLYDYFATASVGTDSENTNVVNGISEVLLRVDGLRSNGAPVSFDAQINFFYRSKRTAGRGSNPVSAPNPGH